MSHVLPQFLWAQAYAKQPCGRVDHVGLGPHNTLQISLGDTANLDAFGRLRVGTPNTLFDSTGIYGRSTLFWHTLTAGAASTTNHLPNESTVEMVCDVGAADYCIRQTKEYFHYQPGKSHMIANTFVFGTAVANVVRRVGYFDASDGIFLEQTGSDVAIVRRTFVSGVAVDNRVVQADWNHDTLDGSSNVGNHSGLTLDLTKAQILVIDLQWLGVGRVRIAFDIDGVLVVVHEFLNANSLSTVYMSTATLPVRYEIRNTGVQGVTHSLKQICSTVVAEAGLEEDFSYAATANNGTTTITAGARRAILSIRPKTTFGPSGKVNRSRVTLQEISLIVGTNNALWEIVYNPTFNTGAGALVWTSAGSESTIEYSVHGDANAGGFTVGIPTQSGYVPAGAGVVQGALVARSAERLPLVLDSTGANPIAVSVVVTPMAGNTVVAAALNWRETR